MDNMNTDYEVPWRKFSLGRVNNMLPDRLRCALHVLSGHPLIYSVEFDAGIVLSPNNKKINVVACCFHNSSKAVVINVDSKSGHE